MFRTLKIVDIGYALSLRTGREERRIARQRRRTGRAGVGARPRWRRGPVKAGGSGAMPGVKSGGCGGSGPTGTVRAPGGPGGSGDGRAGHVRRHLAWDRRGGHAGREAGPLGFGSDVATSGGP